MKVTKENKNASKIRIAEAKVAVAKKNLDALKEKKAKLSEKRVEKDYEVAVSTNDFLSAFVRGIDAAAKKLVDIEENENKEAGKATVTLKSKDGKKAVKIQCNISKDGYRIDTINDVVENCHFVGTEKTDIVKDAKAAGADYSKWIKANLKEEKEDKKKKESVKGHFARKALKESIDPDAIADEIEGELEDEWKAGKSPVQIAKKAKVRRAALGEDLLKESEGVDPTEISQRVSAVLNRAFPDSVDLIRNYIDDIFDYSDPAVYASSSDEDIIEDFELYLENLA